MTVFSNMQISLRDGVKEQAVSSFRARRIFEECAEAIPGFLWALA